MKEEKIVVTNIEDHAWSQNKNLGKFRLKYVADSTQMKCPELCCGVLVLHPGKDPSSSSFTSGNPHYPTR